MAAACAPFRRGPLRLDKNLTHSFYNRQRIATNRRHAAPPSALSAVARFTGRRSSPRKQKDMQHIVSTDELARRYAVKPATIGRWRREGRIPYLRLGYRTMRYDTQACDAALDRFCIRPRWLRDS